MKIFSDIISSNCNISSKKLMLDWFHLVINGLMSNMDLPILSGLLKSLVSDCLITNINMACSMPRVSIRTLFEQL